MVCERACSYISSLPTNNKQLEPYYIHYTNIITVCRKIEEKEEAAEKSFFFTYSNITKINSIYIQYQALRQNSVVQERKASGLHKKQ